MSAIFESMRRGAFTHDSAGLDNATKTFKALWESEPFNGDEELFFLGEEIFPLVAKYWNLKYLSRPENL